MTHTHGLPRGRWLAPATLALVFACESDPTGVRVVVDLRTDLLPGPDYVGTVVELVDSSFEPMQQLAFQADVDVPYRIATFVGVPRGSVVLEVRLVGSNGLPVFRRRVLVEANEDVGVTIVATRSCVGVLCPSDRVCFAGGCVEPTCIEERPELCDVGDCETCADACSADDECGAIGMCGGRCLAGRCSASVTAGCEDMQWCHPELGCIARTRSEDGYVAVLVEGEGVVESSYGTCSTGEYCELRVPIGETVVFEARPGAGRELFSWSDGDDICDPGGPCTITIDSAGSEFVLAAVFEPSVAELVPLTLVPTGPLPGTLDAFALDDDGSVLASSTASNGIYRVQLDTGDTARVELVAGGGNTGAVDGRGAAARFAGPRGIALDGSGNLYVADRGNNLIRRVDPTGLVTTIAGNGTGIRSPGPLLEAGIPGPVFLGYRTLDGAIIVSDNERELWLLELGADRATPIDIYHDGRGNMTMDAAGSVFVSDGDAWTALSPDGESYDYLGYFVGRPVGGSWFLYPGPNGRFAERSDRLTVVEPESAPRVAIVGSDASVPGVDARARIGRGDGTAPVVWLDDERLMLVVYRDSLELWLYRPL